MMGGELELEFPEAIIQSIQSSLTGKEAARTTILSKSWHSAWLTHPILELNESDFKARQKQDDFFAVNEFSKYAKKAVKRYGQLNLKIESFKLCMRINCYASAKLANKLIVRALGKLGPTRLFFRLDERFDFPCGVVFGAENLVELTMQDCQINLDGIDIKCRRLESLCLDGLDSDTVYKIILSCPLIENLSLSNIYHYREWAVAASFVVEAADPTSEVTATAPTINKLDRLKCLVLCYNSFKTLFPSDLLSKFPFLADFTLNLNAGRRGGGDIQISNSSLENIKIARNTGGWGPAYAYDRLKVRLDVPNIRKFTFEGDFIPNLSFLSTTTREWMSHVSIQEKSLGFFGPTGFWCELNQLLTKLRQSKINLSLRVGCIVPPQEYRWGDLSFTHKHELESLTIDMTGVPSLSCYALLDVLFRLCRPKLVTQTHTQKIKDEEEEVPARKTNIDLLWHALEQGMHVSIPRQFMYGLNGLEEANAEIFYDDVMGWRTLIPLESLLSLLEDDVVNVQRVRLLLKWKPS